MGRGECDARCPVCPTADTWKLFATPPSSPGVTVNFLDCSRSHIGDAPSGNSSPSPRLWLRADSLLASTGSLPVLLPPPHRWLTWAGKKGNGLWSKEKKKKEEYPATAGCDWGRACQYFRPAVCWHITARTVTFAFQASTAVVRSISWTALELQ